MTPTERKRKSRAAARAAGITKVEVMLGPAELERLQQLCEIRGGVRGPYTADEFISLLIHRSWQHLQGQLAELGACAHCNSALPQGCAGLLKGDSRCWHTEQAKQLEL
ncbi:hypothetical protein CGX12_11870 [Zobellella denitrificans]|uniref:hypothetical protein n=1 Tax=Zobellella denitrificans TaxID=347534 RepID=UPI000B8C6AFF|nr:hypothetical protein [Zobellella denitrificans]OXS14910.1 hypothetical protein CGX12_11870 [Zobellella denitrificans]